MITTASTLLTTQGWLRADRAPSLVDVVGVDRHGTLNVCPVELTVTNVQVDLCFVGTRAAFGAFHPATRLVDASGIPRTARSIVEAETNDFVRFEHVMELVAPLNSDAACEPLWSELSRAASVDSGTELLYCAHDRTFTRNTKREWMTVKPYGVRHYLTLLRSPYFSAVRSGGLATAGESLMFVFSTKAGPAEVVRTSYPLLLWIALGIRSQGLSYRFVFNTIQHSIDVTLDLDQTCGAIEQIRTGFIGGSAREVVTRWNDRFWNPVVSGFVLAARQS